MNIESNEFYSLDMTQIFKKEYFSQVWQGTTIIPTFRRLIQEDLCKFDTNLGYKVISKPPWSTLWDHVSERQKKNLENKYDDYNHFMYSNVAKVKIFNTQQSRFSSFCSWRDTMYILTHRRSSQNPVKFVSFILH